MADERRAGAERSQTLDRGLAVLELLADAPTGLTYTQLAAELGVGRPVVYRLVASLSAKDFVSRRSDGRLTLGMGLTRLASSVLPLLRDAAVPLLRGLADEAGATAHLTVAEGEEALAIAVVEPRWTDLHVSYRVGSRHALHAGAAGRAILAGRRTTAEGTGVSTAYVSTDGELQAGAHGLAAPVLGIPGLEASVGVVCLGAFDDAAVAPKVVACATALAGRLAGH
ncbi:IclR family transcriptional regulator [Leekyejoonella antrihumi]|uniref:IclR family transcriptional regulator n=1 Tax=Leekyejoonella antrihumi TaxID=1660198 RepID=A0A563DZR5_9MICO|nr:helix-turn-helix domain-containing protein [Leekyejoonella antrihumi]TWP35727.1 IclR family transcriptional regulator [Leekyejoonella antrihumi]